MPKLFEITQDILAAYETMVDSDGEVLAENMAALETLAKIEADKLDSYYYLIKKAEMESAAAQAMVDQWAKKVASRQNFIAYMKKAIHAHMTATGQAKAITPNGNTFAVQKNGGKVPVLPLGSEVFDLSQIPEAYIKTVLSLDTDAVRADLEAGEQLPFATLGERGTHLRLR